MGKIKGVCILLLLALGCSEVANVKQENVEPVGTLQGKVTDDLGVALANVSVWVLLNGIRVNAMNSAGIEGPTSADGIYYFEDLPLGTDYTVHFELNGYAPSILNIDLTPSTPTDFPQGNAVFTLDATLYKEDAGLKGKIEWLPPSESDYVPCPDADVILDPRNCKVDKIYRTKTDREGLFTLENLPGSYTGDFNGCRPRLIIYTTDSENHYHLKEIRVNLYHGATYDIGTIQLERK